VKVTVPGTRVRDDRCRVDNRLVGRCRVERRRDACCGGCRCHRVRGRGRRTRVVAVARVGRGHRIGPTPKKVVGLQLAAGRVAVQSVVTPDVNTTVPVAPASPLSASVGLMPNGTLAGVALTVNDVVATVTVSAVVAVEPA